MTNQDGKLKCGDSGREMIHFENRKQISAKKWKKFVEQLEKNHDFESDREVLTEKLKS